MTNKSSKIFVGLCVLAFASLCTVPLNAQNSEVKEKPPMYSYVANWQIPRAHWADMPQEEAANKPILDKALADGTIIGYGNDMNLVHQPEGYTHDDWWASMSMAGLLNVLDQFYAANQVATPALDTASRHEDFILVSRYYNWHPGAYKNALVQVAQYSLKPGAPDDAVDMLSKNLIVPLMESLISDGTILEYEVDEQAIHTYSPNTFWIVWVSPSSDGADKVSAALRKSISAHPLSTPAFLSVVDFTQHRDELWRGMGVYK